LSAPFVQLGQRGSWLGRLAFCLALAPALAGCAPQIGDKCTISTDCSQLGDRLCDITQPEGYCTIFNCEPDTCPDSVCVAFDPKLDPACGYTDDGRSPRFERTFCLRPCDDDSDCRDEYMCVNLLKDKDDRNADGACGKHTGELVSSADDLRSISLIVDQQPTANCVCMVRPNGVISAPSSGNEVPGVCEPAQDAGPWTPYDGGAGGAP